MTTSTPWIVLATLALLGPACAASDAPNGADATTAAGGSDVGSSGAGPTTTSPGGSDAADDAASEDGSGGGSTSGPDPAASSSTSGPPDGESSESGPVELGCDTPMFEQMGEVKVLAFDDSYWSVNPLPRGASFRCLRIEYDLQTVDSQQAILDMYPGCPIFLGISALDGQGPGGKALASMLFKPWKVGCTPGPDRVELDTFADANVVPGPWPLGGTYHVAIEVNLDTETTTIDLSQDGAPLGPQVSSAITGATLDNARDPRFGIGMMHPAGDAYFPDYGATYSNVRITAELAR